MKMGRRLRCSSVAYRSDMLPPRALPAAHFDRNKIPRTSGQDTRDSHDDAA